jgi:hypothetical protein
MVELDLDIIADKRKTVRISGKEVAFKKLTVGEKLANEAKLEELADLKIGDPEQLKRADEVVIEYLMTILELEKEEAEMVSLEKFQKIREYLERQAMYDKGFNDREIDAMEKKALKKQIAQR